MCTGDIAWIVVGAIVVLIALFLILREMPAIIRELRIMKM
jgi:hypothetical protein